MFRFFRSTLGHFVLAMGVIILLIFLHFTHFLRPVENAFLVITRPMEKVFFQGLNKIDNFFKLLISIRDLSRENQDLREENDRLIAGNIGLQEAKKENAFLREQLQMEEAQGIAGIGAEVIGRNEDNLIQSIKINRGSSQGVKMGAAVASGEGFLIGRVIEVFYNTANVLLITDQNSVVNAMTAEGRASGNARGQHGLGIAMEMIPQTESVKAGDAVFSSGLSEDFPKGLLIGKIVKIETKSGELFQKAQLRPFANLSKLERVLVIQHR